MGGVEVGLEGEVGGMEERYGSSFTSVYEERIRLLRRHLFPDETNIVSYQQSSPHGLISPSPTQLTPPTA